MITLTLIKVFNWKTWHYLRKTYRKCPLDYGSFRRHLLHLDLLHHLRHIPVFSSGPIKPWISCLLQNAKSNPIKNKSIFVMEKKWENLICLRDRFKSFALIGILIRMILQRQLPICLFQFIFGCGRRNAQNIVVFCFFYHCFSSKYWKVMS